MHVAVTFDLSSEGNERENISGEELDVLKQSLADAVKSQDSSWFDFERNGNTFHPNGNLEYGGLYGNEVYKTYECSKLRFTEFS